MLDDGINYGNKLIIIISQAKEVVAGNSSPVVTHRIHNDISTGGPCSVSKCTCLSSYIHSYQLSS